MTVGEFKQFCREHEVSDDTELCIERGIDIIDYVGEAVYNQLEVVLYPKTFMEEIESNGNDAEEDQEESEHSVA